MRAIDGAASTRWPGVRPLVTADHDVIRRWAGQHQAEPATGEATDSGPATVAINDGGSGLRFNFPGAARFRAISWDEWFEHFDRRELWFVYEGTNTEHIARRAHELWHARGEAPGHDWEDWFEAERELGVPSPRYRIVDDQEAA